MTDATPNGVTYRIEVTQDDTPVRGNALASGDDAEDKACEDAILARLDSGDVWAWALVVVVAELAGFRGTDSLGACSYTSEADFRASDYFDMMREQARGDLMREIAETRERLARVDGAAP